MKQTLSIIIVLLWGGIHTCLAQLDGNGNYNKNILNLKHPTSGGNFIMNFHSKVNYGSDKAFILFQDESANNLGSGTEDLRLTIGVHNDFRQSSSHSDEFWLQGGGRLVYNVGAWDSELNSIIGSPGTGTTGGFEWRVNNSEVLKLGHDGNLVLSQASSGYRAYDVENSSDLIVSRFEATTDGTGQLWLKNTNGDYRAIIRAKSTAPSCIAGELVLGEYSGVNKGKTLFVQGDSQFSGNVGIGTTTPDAKLTVKGDIHAERVKVDLNIPAPDYVFEADYDLRSLEETASYIQENKHLPEVPSAKELEASGIDLVEMNMLLLKKIEELTLHMIALKKDNESQQKEIENLKRQ
ncbi:MAG: hypothetical protein ABJO02_18430 [Reichenbachiella sp.]|uniref:hypothetical protein n=1 Tax=Reichenbachiella sp. TaxID=2184521 RepID=UPI0032967D24